MLNVEGDSNIFLALKIMKQKHHRKPKSLPLFAERQRFQAFWDLETMYEVLDHVPHKRSETVMPGNERGRSEIQRKRHMTSKNILTHSLEFLFGDEYAVNDLRVYLRRFDSCDNRDADCIAEVVHMPGGGLPPHPNILPVLGTLLSDEGNESLAQTFGENRNSSESIRVEGRPIFVIASKLARSTLEREVMKIHAVAERNPHHLMREDTWLNIMEQLLDAVLALKARRIAHRDISLKNIYVDRTLYSSKSETKVSFEDNVGVIRLGDFGGAIDFKALGLPGFRLVRSRMRFGAKEGNSGVHPTDFLGGVGVSPPEIFMTAMNGAERLDYCMSDEWSLGVVGYMMLFGLHLENSGRELRNRNGLDMPDEEIWSRFVQWRAPGELIIPWRHEKHYSRTVNKLLVGLLRFNPRYRMTACEAKLVLMCKRNPSAVHCPAGPSSAPELCKEAIMWRSNSVVSRLSTHDIVADFGHVR
jgi:serine/threonine protein kinase